MKGMEWLLRSQFTLLYSESFRSLIRIFNAIDQSPKDEEKNRPLWISLLLSSDIPSLLLSLYSSLSTPSDHLNNQSPRPSQLLPSLLQLLFFLSNYDGKSPPPLPLFSFPHPLPLFPSLYPLFPSTF